MHMSSAELMGWVQAWWWPFIRISAFVAALPILVNRPVPIRVRVGLALALTLVVAPTVPPMPVLEPFSIRGAVVTAQQVLIGLALAFGVRLVFIALEIAGQQIAQQMGIGFAALVDPQSGIDVPVVSNFYIILGTLVFLGFDGHLVLIEALARSFVTLPVSSEGLGTDALWMITGGAGWIFSAAVMMALPAVAALLAVNLAFGVLSRSAPQLNVFVVGFPVAMLLGFVLMMLSLPGVLAMLPTLFEHAVTNLERMAEGAP